MKCSSVFTIFFYTILYILLLSHRCQGIFNIAFDKSGCSNDDECRVAINTKFYLHTRENPNHNINMVVSASEITSTSFQASRPTKFIVHGYLDTGDKEWLLRMTKALLQYGDYNVIRVDWRRGSITTYQSAADNTRFVGLEISAFINNLIQKLGLNPGNVHCIGHSLGGHACGFAGNGVLGMGRITGLDPLGGLLLTTVTLVKLDPSDAVFVDVIHTNLENLVSRKTGLLTEPVGHIEIFPNSGSDQPGCTILNNVKNIFSRDIMDSARNFVYCNHLRAIEYFIESILNRNCQWVAYECSDYSTFQQGKCFSCGADNSKCAFLGIRADEYVAKNRINAKFFINTNANENFCAYEYVVSILTSSAMGDNLLSSGILVIKITGINNGHLFLIQKYSRYEHGNIISSLITSRNDLGTIARVDVEWVSNACFVNPFCNKKIYVVGVKVSSLNRYPESERLSSEVIACQRVDGSPTPISHKDTQTFLVNKNCPSF